MRKSFLVCAVLALIAGAGIPGAWAQDAATTGTFSLPGADFAFPLPDGYCLPPPGQFATIAATTASADKTNLTDISFFSCSEVAAGTTPPTTWGMVKTPLASVNASDNKRQDLVTYFKSQVNPADLQKMFEEGGKEGEKGLQSVLGAGVSVGLDVKPLDTDDDGAYFGGTVKLNLASGEQRIFSCAFSATVIKGRIVFVYVYGPYTDVRDVTGLLAIVKTTTAKFVAANGG